MQQVEFSTAEIRKILQLLFPNRKLVLSQFTFYNQIGVARPSGDSYRRGRRCYRVQDILPIAAILALKEEGIPLKNIESAPDLLHENLDRIFSYGRDCLLSGYGEQVFLRFPDSLETTDPVLDSFLGDDRQTKLYWSYDVGLLASRLRESIADYLEKDIRRAA